jgi:hypothetical protein
MPSSSAADIVTVNKSPPFRGQACPLGCEFPVRHFLVLVKRAACLPACPAAARDAFLAGIGAVPGHCAAWARPADTAADQAVYHDLTTSS